MVGPASTGEGGSATYGLGGSIGGGANLAAHKIGVHLKRGVLLEGSCNETRRERVPATGWWAKRSLPMSRTAANKLFRISLNAPRLRTNRTFYPICRQRAGRGFWGRFGR